MNLHPIFIHFPIALLSLYALLEILRFKKITTHPAYFYTKAVLIIAGTLGALFAIGAGDSAAKAVRDGMVLAQIPNPGEVIQLHEFLAHVSTFIFILAAASYTSTWLHRLNAINYLPGNILKSIWKFGMRISTLILETPLIIILAVSGIILLLIVAALGGSIVYGVDSDPFVKIIYSLFFQH